VDCELTNLPSRNRFIGWLKGALANCGKKNRGSALLVISVHNIRSINREAGIAAGDALLKELSRRLKKGLRAEDVLARIDSTQFGAILPGISSTGVATLAANKVVRICNQLVQMDDVILKPRVTVGVAMIESPGQSWDELLTDADHAADTAMDNVEGYAVADQVSCGDDRTYTMLEAELERAIESNEIIALYQPKIDINLGRIAGVELLTRWQRSNRDWIGPEIFIDLAEHSGLILPLTIRTLHTALRELQSLFRTVKRFSLALNLSPVLLDNPDITDLIMNAMEIWDTDPRKLTIEITENSLIKNPEVCLAALVKFREKNIKVSLDDFGTGYSSLSYLSTMSVDELKIDKSFVMTMNEDAGNRKLVDAIIGLGHNFNLTIVAEGVEDAQALATLRSMNCDFAQGYYFGKPMSINDLTRWIERKEMQGQTKKSLNLEYSLG